jgi:hypothetical protein
MNITDLTPEQRLKAAVWMVGNNDTPEDKRAWWASFGRVWDEVATDPDVQNYANAMFGGAETPVACGKFVSGKHREFHEMVAEDHDWPMAKTAEACEYIR